MDAEFCVDALNEAREEYGEPAICNTDQGSQFTSKEFISVLEEHHIEISMDGRDGAPDNICGERLWRSLKYEIRELKEGIKKYFRFYNGERFHQSLDYATPDEMYRSFVGEEETQKAA